MRTALAPPDLLLHYSATVRSIADPADRTHALNRALAHMAGHGVPAAAPDEQLGFVLRCLERYGERTVRTCLGYAQEAAGPRIAALPPAKPARVASLIRQFEGHPVTVVEFKGQQIFFVDEIAAAIGYSRAVNLTNLLRGEWGDEAEEGEEYIVLTNGDIRAVIDLRRMTTGDTRSQSRRGGARKLTVLTEQGVHLVCLKTEKPAGKRLRRWLAREVLPQLRSAGSYAVDPAPQPAPAPEPKPDPGYVSHERFVRIMADILAPKVIAEVARRALPEAPVSYSNGQDGPPPADCPGLVPVLLDRIVGDGRAGRRHHGVAVDTDPDHPQHPIIVRGRSRDLAPVFRTVAREMGLPFGSLRWARSAAALGQSLSYAAGAITRQGWGASKTRPGDGIVWEFVRSELRPWRW